MCWKSKLKKRGFIHSSIHLTCLLKAFRGYQYSHENEITHISECISNLSATSQSVNTSFSVRLSDSTLSGATLDKWHISDSTREAPRTRLRKNVVSGHERSWAEMRQSVTRYLIQISLPEALDNERQEQVSFCAPSPLESD